MAHFNEDHIAYFEAAEEGDVEKMQALMTEKKAHVELEYPHGFGYTPLMKACQYGQPATAKFLIENGAKLSGVKSEAGLTPLAFTLKGRKIELYHMLRAAGADPHGEQSHMGRTLLHSAAEDGMVDFVQAILAEGVEIDALDNDERTPLHLACWWGREEAVATLHQAGASLVPVDKLGKTPPGYLKQQGFKELYEKYNALSPTPGPAYGVVPGLKYMSDEPTEEASATAVAG